MEWLIKIYYTDVIQKLGVEARIQKVQYRMFHTTDIHIYRKHLVRVLVRRAVDELEGGAK